MRSPAGGPDRDLAVAAGLTLAGLVVVAAPLPSPVVAAVLLPLTLLLPGYAVGAALFPPGFVSRDERVVLSVAFGIGAWALGGLLLQIFIDLDRIAWAALLLAVTLPACAVAQSRRREALAALEPARRRLPALTAGAAATTVAAVAIAVASGGAERQLDRARFTELWILPGDAAAAAAAVEVGVRNVEGRAVDYRLRISRGGEALRGWSIGLDSGEAWRRTFAPPAGDADRPIVAALLRDGVVYRRVAAAAGPS